MLSEQEAETILGTLSLLKFFPGDPFARTGFIRLLMRMCAGFTEAQWLADRMIDTYAEWPGPAILRAVYCQKFKPADGVEGNFPVDNPPAQIAQAEEFAKLEAAKRQGALPAGAKCLFIAAPSGAMELVMIDPRDKVVTTNAEWQKKIEDLAELKALPPVEDIDYDTWDDPVAVKLRQMGL